MSDNILSIMANPLEDEKMTRTVRALWMGNYQDVEVPADAPRNHVARILSEQQGVVGYQELPSTPDAPTVFIDPLIRTETSITSRVGEASTTIERQDRLAFSSPQAKLAFRRASQMPHALKQ